MASEKKYYKGSWQNHDSQTPYNGKLAPLMTEEEKQKASIHELSYDFGCRIVCLFQYLTEESEYKEYIMSKGRFYKF